MDFLVSCTLATANAMLRPLRLTLTTFIFLAPVWFAAGSMGGTIVLNSHPSSGTLNGAIFSTSGARPAGSGVIDSFLRVHDVGGGAEGGNGIERGYNSGSPRGPSNFPAGFPNYDAMSGNFTYNIQLGTVGITNQAGADYRTLLLDLNEPGGGQDGIDLTELRIFASPNANVVVPQDAAGLAALLTGNPFGGSVVFDLDVGADGDSTAQLFDLFAGSGQFDVMILIPDALFAGLPDTHFFYLFAQFEGPGGSGPDGGFEEFAAAGDRSTITIVPPTIEVEHAPEPASMLAWILLSGAALAGYRLRRRWRA